MATIANFSTSGQPTGTPRQTLAELMARKKALAEHQGQIMAPREINSPMQGLAQVAATFVNAMQGRRAEQEEASGREQLSQLLAGVDLEKGPTSQQIAQAGLYDPEEANRLQVMAVEAVRARRQREQKLSDLSAEHTYQDTREGRINEREKLETIEVETRAAEAKRIEHERDVREGRVRIVTGEEAKKLGYDPTRQWKVSADGSTLEDVTPDKPKSSRLLTVDEIKAQPNLDPNKAYKIDENGTIGPVESGGINIMTGEAEARKKLAAELGLKEGTPEYQTYVLTGNIPKEAQMSVAEKKMILDADNLVATNERTINTLSSILEGPPGQSLNERAGSGYFAGTQSFLARNDPTGLFNDKKGEATTGLENKILGNALASLKTLFGAAPSDAEQAMLQRLQASIDKTPEERRIIINDAIALAQDKLRVNKQQAEQLRGGTFFSATGGGTAAPAAAPAGGDVPPKPADIPQVEWDNMTDDDKRLYR